MNKKTDLENLFGEFSAEMKLDFEAFVLREKQMGIRSAFDLGSLKEIRSRNFSEEDFESFLAKAKAKTKEEDYLLSIFESFAGESSQFIHKRQLIEAIRAFDPILNDESVLGTFISRVEPKRDF